MTRAFIALLWRDTKGLYRRPGMAMTFVALPLLMIVMMGAPLERLYEDTGDNAWNQTIPGFTLMFSMIIGATMATRITRERREGVWLRFLQAPIPGWMPIIVVGIGTWALVMAQSIALFSLGAIAFDMDVANPGAMLLIIAAFQMIPVGLATLVASMWNEEPKQHIFIMCSAVILASLGGAWVPRSLLYDWMQPFGPFTPHYWALDALHGLMTEHYSIIDILPSFFILVGAASAMLMAGLVRFSRKEVPWS